jgi:ferredoxin
MPHIITSLCLRDGACMDACPNESIAAGRPESEWPWYYIDPDVCIDCGACVTECPYEAIFEEGDVPNAYKMGPGQERVPHGGARYAAKGGEIVDLTLDIEFNAKFFAEGPGH